MTEDERRDAGQGLLRAFASMDGADDSRKVNEEARSIDFICSTDDEDGHGTVIDQASWKLDRYRKNPVVLWNHGTSGGMFGSSKPKDEIPIARAEQTRVEGNQLRTTVVFPPAGEFELSDHVWNAIRSKRVNGISVGFKAGKVAKETVDGRERYRLFNCELFELSPTPIPSNANCIAERSMLAKLADRAKMTGCSMDDCVGPEDCVDIDCPCDCHASRATPKTTTPAQTAPTEPSMNPIEILARMLGCAADEASVVAAVDALKVRAAEPKVEAVAGELLSAPSFDEERRVLTAQIETAMASVRSLADSLGVAADAPSADVTKAILSLQSRAKVADEIEPVVATLTGEVAKLEADVAVREVDFLIKRGKHYGLSLDERSRKALAAYRKADPKGFAEDYKPALDGLRAFDESELFERVAPPVATSVVVTPDAADDRAETDRRVAAYRTKHNCLESVAIDAVMRGRDIG